MLAFVTDEPPYGERTRSPSSTYAQLKHCRDNGIPIIPIRMNKDTRWPPVTREKQGTFQNRMLITKHLVYISAQDEETGEFKDPEDLAAEIAEAAKIHKRAKVDK